MAVFLFVSHNRCLNLRSKPYNITHLSEYQQSFWLIASSPVSFFCKCSRRKESGEGSIIRYHPSKVYSSVSSSKNLLFTRCSNERRPRPVHLKLRVRSGRYIGDMVLINSEVSHLWFGSGLSFCRYLHFYPGLACAGTCITYHSTLGTYRSQVRISFLIITPEMVS